MDLKQVQEMVERARNKEWDVNISIAVILNDRIKELEEQLSVAVEHMKINALTVVQQQEIVRWWKTQCKKTLDDLSRDKRYTGIAERERNRAEKAEQGCRLLINIIPDGWVVPILYGSAVAQVKKLLQENET